MINKLSLEKLNVGLDSPVEPTPLNLTEIYAAQNMKMLDLDNPDLGNSIREWYFSIYYENLTKNNISVRIHSGLYPSHGELLAAHIIEGEDTSSGSIIFTHGLTESVFSPYGMVFAKYYIPKGYRIILLNLPGHEFSGGNRVSIKKFEHYGDMLRDFLHHTEGQLGPKIIATGHSVGATLIYDALVRFPELHEKINASVLISPFSKINLSELLALGSTVFDKLVVGMDFVNLASDATDDKDNRVLNNKLQFIPAGWINLQREWSKQIQSYPVLDELMLILFGSDDLIINVADSHKFYSTKTNNSTITMYEGQDHLLFNTSSKVYKHNADPNTIQSHIIRWIDAQVK